MAARLLSVMGAIAGSELAHPHMWTTAAINVECSIAYRAYDRALERHYTEVLARDGVAEERWIAKGHGERAA